MDLFTDLRTNKPRFHGEHGDERWRIDWDTLRWLFRTVRADSRRLETGCGYSTLAFAAAGAARTVVSPDADEQARVRGWCAERGVSTDRATFVVEGSDRWLPRSCPDRLDLVLIDGNHAFPWPFIDGFYTAPHLNVGGLVVVDDTHVRTGALQARLPRRRGGALEAGRVVPAGGRLREARRARGRARVAEPALGRRNGSSRLVPPLTTPSEYGRLGAGSTTSFARARATSRGSIS